MIFNKDKDAIIQLLIEQHNESMARSKDIKLKLRQMEMRNKRIETRLCVLAEALGVELINNPHDNGADQ